MNIATITACQLACQTAVRNSQRMREEQEAEDNKKKE